jgi:hypothetical protein
MKDSILEKIKNKKNFLLTFIINKLIKIYFKKKFKPQQKFHCKITELPI